MCQTCSHSRFFRLPLSAMEATEEITATDAAVAMPVADTGSTPTEVPGRVVMT